eukprot:IDg6121t1
MSAGICVPFGLRVRSGYVAKVPLILHAAHARRFCIRTDSRDRRTRIRVAVLKLTKRTRSASESSFSGRRTPTSASSALTRASKIMLKERSAGSVPGSHAGSGTGAERIVRAALAAPFPSSSSAATRRCEIGKLRTRASASSGAFSGASGR